MCGLNKINKLADEIEKYISIVDDVIEQTCEVNGGMFILKTVLSVYLTLEPGSLKKGKAHEPVEFGHKILIGESKEGIITYYNVFEGNPRDESPLTEVVRRQCDAVGCISKEVAADRGFYSADNEDVLEDIGVKCISIPQCGRKTKERR